MNKGISPRLFWRVSLLCLVVGAAVLGGVSLTRSMAQNPNAGLRADYYSDTQFSKLVLSRTDSTVNFDWGAGSPDPNLPADHFSVRWTGEVMSRYTESYTFYTISDDGIRLWVDNHLLVDNWTLHGKTENKGTISLNANRRYAIKMEFYEHTGQATAQLAWSSKSQSREIIPSSQIFPTAANAITVPKTRDPRLWPFAANSIWNMPIGAEAKYVAANFAPGQALQGDDNYLIFTKTSDPQRTVYAPGAWGPGRCTGTQPMGSDKIYFPDNVVVRDAANNWTPNNATAVVQPDGHSMVQIEPLARCQAGGNVYGYIACGWGSRQDLLGDGLCGGHLGSGLSSIGGMIRKGELTNTDPIRHALQLEVWGRQYLYYNKNSATPGYRWPASRSDSYAPGTDGYCSLDPCKSHPNPDLVQGSLLAIPPSVTLDSLKLKSEAGKKLFYTLQNYGGYIVDDSGWQDYNLGMEYGVKDEFKQAFGYDLEGNGAFHDDFNTLFTALSVVSNNGPKNIGGGGTPRAALAPALPAN